MASLKQVENFTDVQLTKLLAEYVDAVPEIIQLQGLDELRFIRDAYNASFVYAAGTGLQTPILPFGARWAAIKAAKGWDQRRGWAKATGLGAAVGRKSTMRTTATGFYFDLTRTNKRLRNYWKDFNRIKAKGGLMQFKAGVVNRMRDRVRKELEGLVKRILGRAAKVGGNKQVIKVIQVIDMPFQKFKRNQNFRSNR